MELSFSGSTFSWRGPAPFVFIALPEDISQDLRTSLRELSYGWGCIPVLAKIGQTVWKTSLMPRNGVYLLPVKQSVQLAEGIGIGDSRQISIELG